MSARHKVFTYVTRITDRHRELLVFDSLDEPGFEVPKGAVEPGESLEEAFHRELLEEAGIAGARIVGTLGSADWRDEQQHAFLAAAPPTLPRRFEHIVTGDGIDAGRRYRFSWLPIDAALRGRLVQGCGQFVSALIAFDRRGGATPQ